MRARRAAGQGLVSGRRRTRWRPLTDAAAGGAGDAGARARVAARVAAGGGLLTIALAVAAVPWWPPAEAGENLLERLAGILALTVGVPFAAMGALLCARRPGNRIGWLLLIGGLSATVLQFAGDYVQRGGRGLPARPLVALLGISGGIVAVTALMFLLLLYPDGRLVSRRWGPVAWAAGTGCALEMALVLLSPEVDPGLDNPIGLGGAPGELVRRLPADTVGGTALIVLLLASLASLVVRLRRARGVERQQLKWLVYATTVAAVTTLALPFYWWTGGFFTWLAIWTIPVAIGVAVLRHRLYDIEQLINRTLVYGLLTAALGGSYAGVVLVLGQVFGGLGDQPPSWAVAGATLAVAALFRPARRRIQEAVDRRFNRRRYDAAKTIEVFSVRLRDEIDLDTLLAELLATVDQTVQPTTASLWLRQRAPHSP